MSLQILVIDDSKADQLLFKGIVQQAFPTCVIQSAFDGNEAIALLDKKEVFIDIIFLDINMPRMNGYQFMEAYGKTLNERGIPVYILTASSRKRESKLFSPYQCVVDLCTKSAGYDQVIDIICRHADTHKLKIVNSKA